MRTSTNIMETLRQLVPQRPLTWSEGETIAELQANRLRELLGISGPNLPEEAISYLPRIEVRRDYDLPVSGVASWERGKWLILLNASEPVGRQRFSLAHEFKHALDHSTKHWLFPAGAGSSEEKAEALADYFAGCLLMPKRHVKRLFGERRTLAQLAEAFDVTPRAMAVRVSQLGLIEATPRCNRPTLASRQPGKYFRRSSQSRHAQIGIEGNNFKEAWTDPGPPIEGSVTTPGEGVPTAIIYLRVSTKEQAEMGGQTEGFSIPAQRDACRRKAEALGCVLVEEFVDRGESARSADRPELQRLLKYVTENRVDFVIVHKVDRLARNRFDDVTINLALKRAGATLVSVTENIDETPSGMLLHGIMSSIAEFYSRNLANEVIKGSLEKAKNGGTVYRAPLGYKNVTHLVNGRQVRTVAKDRLRAPLVQWAFEAYASGEWTLLTLHAELQRRGLTRPAGPNTPEGSISHSTLHRILRNTYYVGIVEYRGVAYAGNHRPLVSEAVFSEVQAILDAQLAGEKQRRHNHYLKGSVFCGQCGSRLIVNRAKNRFGSVYFYFVCVGRHQKRTSCLQRAVLISDVDAGVEKCYGSIQLEPERVDDLRSFVKRQFAWRRTAMETEARRQAKRVRQLEAEQMKLLQAHYADALPLDLLKREQERISRDLKAAQNRLKATEANFRTIEDNLETALRLAGDCQAMYLGAEPRIRRLMNQAFFTRLVVEVDGGVRGELAAPFELLLGDDLLKYRAKLRQRGQELVEKESQGQAAGTPVFVGQGWKENVLVPPARHVLHG